MGSVGIVGGLGVGATVHYYEKITAACKARGVIPDLAIIHADVDKGQGFVREGRLDALADYLASFIERLERAGAAAAGLPAVTPHICVHELTSRIKLPLINIVEAIGAELRKRQLRRVALFGTTFTMQGSLWGQLSGVEIVKPQPDEIAFAGRAYQRSPDTQRGRVAAAGRRRGAPARRHRPCGHLRRGDGGLPLYRLRARAYRRHRRK